MKDDRQFPIEQCHSLLDDLPIQLWTMTDRYTYGFVNKAHADFFGVDKKDLAGKKVKEILGAEKAQYIYRTYERAREERRQAAIEIWFQNHKKECRLLSIMATPVWNDDGNLRYIICKAQDITQQREKENDFKINAQRYEAIVENQKELICRFLPDTTLTFVNQAYCQYFQKSREELIHTKFLDLVPEKDRRFILDILKKFSVEKPVQTYDHRVIHPDGSILWQRWTDQAIFDDNGNIIEFQSVGTDITEYKSMMEALQHDYKRIERLVKKRTKEIQKTNFKLQKEIAERKGLEQKLYTNIQLLKKSLNSSINVILEMIAIRDPYTVYHQERVAYLAYHIARELNLPASQINCIYIAALLHDVGKIYVPADFLSKPSRLTEWEMNIIKMHVEVGCNLLSKMEFPWPIHKIIQQHHEKIDGSGYPFGLTDKNILPEAKIIAVADVVEAMSSHRPYRPAFPVETTLEEIEKYKGIYYDADAVDACLKLFREKGFRCESTKLDISNLLEHP